MTEVLCAYNDSIKSCSYNTISYSSLMFSMTASTQQTLCTLYPLTNLNSKQEFVISHGNTLLLWVKLLHQNHCRTCKQLTLPLAWGMPSVVSRTPPSSAASAKLYPEMASVDDLRRCMRVTHLSMKIVICDGRATAILRRHQAADRRAAGDGCINTDTTGSTIPAHTIHNQITDECHRYSRSTVSEDGSDRSRQAPIDR